MPASAPRLSLFARCSFLAMASCALGVLPAGAAPRHSSIHTASQTRAGGVSFDHAPFHGGGRDALVTDGPGTGFGFHRLPAPFRYAAASYRERQSSAVRAAVVTDALTSGNGNDGFGLRGDSVYGYGNRASYGVFSGSDGYGSPYFAGYYGPGGGADLGPLGHAYE